jgi:hypothetical protein
VGVRLVMQLVRCRRWLGPFWRRLGLGQSCLRVCRAPAIRRSPRPGTRGGRSTGHKRPNRACWIGREWERRSPTVETYTKLCVAMTAGIRPEPGEAPRPPQDHPPLRRASADRPWGSPRGRSRWPLSFDFLEDRPGWFPLKGGGKHPSPQLGGSGWFPRWFPLCLLGIAGWFPEWFPRWVFEWFPEFGNHFGARSRDIQHE